MNSCLPSWATSPDGAPGALVIGPWMGPTTWCAPVTQCDVASMAMTPARVIPTMTKARVRWPVRGSTLTSSRRSTPRNMITKRKRTTMAPA